MERSEGGAPAVFLDKLLAAGIFHPYIQWSKHSLNREWVTRPTCGVAMAIRAADDPADAGPWCRGVTTVNRHFTKSIEQYSQCNDLVGGVGG